jgi:hypothetical protein
MDDTEELLLRMARWIWKNHVRPHALNQDICEVCQMLKDFEANNRLYWP